MSPEQLGGRHGHERKAFGQFAPLAANARPRRKLPHLIGRRGGVGDPVDRIAFSLSFDWPPHVHCFLRHVDVDRRHGGSVPVSSGASVPECPLRFRVHPESDPAEFLSDCFKAGLVLAPVAHTYLFQRCEVEERREVAVFNAGSAPRVQKLKSSKMLSTTKVARAPVGNFSSSWGRSVPREARARARSWRPGLCPMIITELTDSGRAWSRSSSSRSEAA
jgi:hypothetical protein